MLCRLTRTMPAFALLALVFLFGLRPAAAADTVLSNNSGSDNAVFYIKDEPSLVMNGFDLTPLDLQLPLALDAVSIAVNRPIPGRPIDLVVYQDSNGGSPLDAELVYRQTVRLNQPGNNRIALAKSAIITQPVVWVGFYLPVGLHFYADQSGTSVLTYWAWTPGGTFNPNSLANAGLLGPGDGSEPIAIDMSGVARITAEAHQPELAELLTNLAPGQQLVADAGQETAALQAYANCGGLLYDAATSAANSFTLDCRPASDFDAPSDLVQPDNHYLDLQRAGRLYKIAASIPEHLHAVGDVSRFPQPVTHCLPVPAEDLAGAVLGEARGIPEKWHILPSLRINDLICADVTVANYLSYFLPRSPESPPNVNLVLGWSRVQPHPLQCGVGVSIQAPVVNTGQSWFKTATKHVKISVQDVHVASGAITTQRDLQVNVDQFGPGARRVIETGPLHVSTYVNELHRLQIRVDSADQIEETNELDNIWFTEYMLQYPTGSDECASPGA